MEHEKKSPGDLILDRYMPDATCEEREEARANLKRLAQAYITIIERLIAEGDGDVLRERPAENATMPGIQSA